MYNWTCVHVLLGEAQYKALGALVHITMFENVEDTILAYENHLCIRFDVGDNLFAELDTQDCDEPTHHFLRQCWTQF